MAENFSTILSPTSAQAFTAALAPQSLTTILTPVSSRSISTARTALQVSLFNAARLNQSQSLISSQATRDANTIERESDRFASLADDIRGAVEFLENVIERIDNIRDLTDDAIGIAFEARNGDENSFFALAQTFDSFLRQVTSRAEFSIDSPNLLGRQPQRDFTYPTTLLGTTESVSEAYLASSYTITDTNGDLWVREGTSTPVLRQYDGTSGAATGEFASVLGGIRLDGYTESTDAVDFTVSFETADAQSFSGTLSREGLGALDSWLYEDLQTVDGRSRAIADLEGAKTIIDGNRARLESELATARFYLDQATINVDSAQVRIGDVTQRELLALQELEQAFNQLAALSVAAIEGNLALRNEYLFLLPGGNNGFTNALVDVLA